MPTLPALVARVFMHLNYHEEYWDEVLTAFTSHWGGLDEELLLRALRNGSHDECLLAMHLLTFARLPTAREAIRPFLMHDSREIRWRAIECLARLGDAEGIAALVGLLTDELPTPERYVDEATRPGALEHLRIGALSLLGAVGTPSHVSALRAALEWYLRTEKGFSHEMVDPPSNDPPSNTNAPEHAEGAVLNAYTTIHFCQERAVFALGRLGALGALTGLDLEGVCDLWGTYDAEARLKLWQIHLLLGYCTQQGAIGALPLSEEDKAALQGWLSTHVERIFGFSHDESERTVRRLTHHFYLALLPVQFEQQEAQESHIRE